MAETAKDRLRRLVPGTNPDSPFQVVIAYEGTRRRAASLFAQMARETGLNSAEDEDERAECRRQIRDHKLHAEYVTARRTRDAAVLVIAEDVPAHTSKIGFDGLLETDERTQEKLKADIATARKAAARETRPARALTQATRRVPSIEPRRGIMRSREDHPAAVLGTIEDERGGVFAFVAMGKLREDIARFKPGDALWMLGGIDETLAGAFRLVAVQPARQRTAERKAVLPSPELER